jgi:D-mannonate dehydratase
MTADAPAAIRRFASLGAIYFVRFRDVRGTARAIRGGDSNTAPGYSTLARFWAVGCTQRLLEAAT